MPGARCFGHVFGLGDFKRHIIWFAVGGKVVVAISRAICDHISARDLVDNSPRSGLTSFATTSRPEKWSDQHAEKWLQEVVELALPKARSVTTCSGLASPQFWRGHGARAIWRSS